MTFDDIAYDESQDYLAICAVQLCETQEQLFEVTGLRMFEVWPLAARALTRDQLLDAIAVTPRAIDGRLIGALPFWFPLMYAVSVGLLELRDSGPLGQISIYAIAEEPLITNLESWLDENGLV